MRRRFLAPAIERANAALTDDVGEPMQQVSPHGLRRSFVSLLLAAGADASYVMAQAGHSDLKDARHLREGDRLQDRPRSRRRSARRER